MDITLACDEAWFWVRYLLRTATHLVHHVIPRVPVRQWVLSLPSMQRLPLELQSGLINSVPHVVLSGSREVPIWWHFMRTV